MQEQFFLYSEIYKFIDKKRKPYRCSILRGIGVNPDIQLITQSLAKIQADPGSILFLFSSILPGKAFLKDPGQISFVDTHTVILNI